MSSWHLQMSPRMLDNASQHLMIMQIMERTKIAQIESYIREFSSLCTLQALI